MSDMDHGPSMRTPHRPATDEPWHVCTHTSPGPRSVACSAMGESVVRPRVTGQQPGGSQSHGGS
eukprot:5050582-Prymnesium_polylepis.1